MSLRTVGRVVATALLVAASVALVVGFFFVWVIAPVVAILAYWLVDILVFRRRRRHGPAKRAALALEADARAREVARARRLSAEKLL